MVNRKIQMEKAFDMITRWRVLFYSLEKETHLFIQFGISVVMVYSISDTNARYKRRWTDEKIPTDKKVLLCQLNTGNCKLYVLNYSWCVSSKFVILLSVCPSSFCNILVNTLELMSFIVFWQKLSPMLSYKIRKPFDFKVMGHGHHLNFLSEFCNIPFRMNII